MKLVNEMILYALPIIIATYFQVFLLSPTIYIKTPKEGLSSIQEHPEAQNIDL